LIKKLKPKSEFTRNVLTLMTGTTIAQAIPIAISPILTRLYTPEDFGVFALFVSIVSILGSVAAGRYELAIMLPKKDEDAINIVALGIIITSIFSLIIFLVILFFHSQIVSLLNNKEISLWLYFIPLVVFLTGLYNILNYWNNRKKYYKDLAKATVLKSIAGSITQLILGFLKVGATGLISGQIVSQIFANGKLIRNLLKEKVLLKSMRKVKIILMSKKYKKFFLITTFHTLLGNISNNLPVLLLSKLSYVIGQYSLSMRILSVFTLFSNSYNQVFFEKFCKTNNKYIFFKKNLLKFVLLTIPFVIISYFIFPYVFKFVFGSKWVEAGEYSKIFVFLIYFQILSNIFASSVYNYYQYQFENLIIETVYLLNIILSFLLSFNSYKNFFIYMSFFGSFIMLIKIYRSFRIVYEKIY